MSLKGFIGPLGDDLPSIFPIVAAIFLFIGTIFFANQIVDQKNKELGLRQGVLSLSYLVTQKGLFDNRNEFKNVLCEDQLKKQASSLQIHFLVTVKKYCQNLDFYKPGVSPDYASPFYLEETAATGGALAQGRTWAFCTNQYENGQLFDLKNNRPVLSQEFPVPEDAVVLSYPVAVPCEIDAFPTKGIGLINVIGWR